jgi:mRNA interferase MazF
LNRGEIWYVKLDPTEGSGLKKTRRAAIVSNDILEKLPLKVIVPLIKWKDHYKEVPWMVKIEPDRFNKLDEVSAADAFQIRSVSVDRFGENAEGHLSRESMEQIIEAVATVISEI